MDVAFGMLLIFAPLLLIKIAFYRQAIAIDADEFMRAERERCGPSDDAAYVRFYQSIEDYWVAKRREGEKI